MIDPLCKALGEATEAFGQIGQVALTAEKSLKSMGSIAVRSTEEIDDLQKKFNQVVKLENHLTKTLNDTIAEVRTNIGQLASNLAKQLSEGRGHMKRFHLFGVN